MSFLIGWQHIFSAVLPGALQQPGKIAHRSAPHEIILGNCDPRVVCRGHAKNRSRRIAAAVVAHQQGPIGIRFERECFAAIRVEMLLLVGG